MALRFSPERLQTRFILWLSTILVMLLVLIFGILYYNTSREVERTALGAIRQLSTSVTATQDYVRHTLRPRLYELVGQERFVIEAMSTSFVARKVIDNLLESYPEYYFKFATRKPFNPDNLADIKERAIIDTLKEDPTREEWLGGIERDGVPYLSVATPITYVAPCMRCHGVPEAAPEELLARYPAGGGFGIEELDIAILSIGVPLSRTRAEVLRDTLINLVPIGGLMLLFILLALYLFRRYVSAPTEVLQQGAGAIMAGHYDTEVTVRGGAEFERIGEVFNHMARGIRDEIERRRRSEAQVLRDFQTQQALSQILQLSLQPLSLQAQLERVLQILLALPWLEGDSRGCLFLGDSVETLRLSGYTGEDDPPDCLQALLADPVCIRAISAQQPLSDSGLSVGADAAGTLPQRRHYAPIVGQQQQLLGLLVLCRFDAAPEEKEDELSLLGAVAGSLSAMIERQRSEAALRVSEERYALAVNGASDGIWDWNIREDHVYMSPRLCGMLGLTRECAPASSVAWFERIHPEDVERVRSAVDAHLHGEASSFSCEFRMRDGEDRWIWMQSRGVAVFDKGGEPLRMAGSQTDISERKRMEQQLEHDAFHDPLSGLFNRAFLVNRLRQVLAHTNRHPQDRFALLYLDLDRFKTINDSMGHSAGDQMIIEVAQRLRKLVRPEDTVARLGGDEFVLLLGNIDDAVDATHAAERIHAELSRPLEVGEHQVYTSASIGIVLSSPHYRRGDEILRDADTAMYRAKERGKALYQVFDAEMHQQVVAQLHLENDLRRALERDELTAYFQPIVALADGQIVGFEALARWQHPQRGLVPPLEFIPLAEETGLIADIGQHMVELACRAIRDWQSSYPETAALYVSINLSSRELLHSELLPQVMQRLEQYRVRPEQIRFEVTESVLMDDSKSTSKLLRQLREHGFRLYIDDFGTGYSSLSYLHAFPFDTLKIDRSFTSELKVDGDSGVVNSIISLARNLRMDVVAEGVENAYQQKILAALGCEYTQGYHYSPPVPADQAAELLRRQLADAG